MIRSVLAILTGHIIFTVASVAIFMIANRDPHQSAPMSFMVLSTEIGAVFACAGGFVTATIARRRPLQHALALTALLALEASVLLMLRPAGSDIWSQLAVIYFMAPAATLGGWFRKIFSRS
jgi:hypothetical protein